MKPITPFILTAFAIVLAACAAQPAQPTPTLTPSPTGTPTQPPPTAVPTDTLVPTDTPVPPTSTPIPQQLLLRRSCGKDYAVKANEAVQIYYGGWSLRGEELANQWATALVVELEIDGELIPGEIQGPVPDLPYNCPKDLEDSYWLYFIATIPGLEPGDHQVSVTFNSLKALPDGYGDTYRIGPLSEQTFTITAQ